MKTTKGELRNITSGTLHTNIEDVYKFFNEFTGQRGMMTHHLPSAAKAIMPFLKSKLSDEWFTDEWIKDELDAVVEIADPTEDEKTDFWEKFHKFNMELIGGFRNVSVKKFSESIDLFSPTKAEDKI